MSRYTKVGRGRINGELCDVAIDESWSERVTIFCSLVARIPKLFYMQDGNRMLMCSSVAYDRLGDLRRQGVIDQDAYRAAIAAHVERML